MFFEHVRKIKNPKINTLAVLIIVLVRLRHVMLHR